MSLYQRLLTDLTTAMKEKNAQKLGVLRMMKAAFLNLQKAKPQADSELSDEEVLITLSKEAKKRKESAAVFAQAGRPELAQQEEYELSVIESYLPQQLSDDEIRTIVRDRIAHAEKKEFAAVMPLTMKELKGRADGNRVKAIVQECLA